MDVKWADQERVKLEKRVDKLEEAVGKLEKKILKLERELSERPKFKMGADGRSILIGLEKKSK